MKDSISIIDVHHHIVPPHMSGKNGMPKWTIEKDKELMVKLGIKGVLLSIPAGIPHDQVRGFNEYLAKLITFDSKFYGMLASVPFDDVDTAISEIDYCYDTLNVDGFCMPTNYNGIYIGDERLKPLLKELDGHKAVVLLHPSRPAGENLPTFNRELSVYEYPFETTRAMMDYIYKDRIREFPNIKWIISHAGGTIPYLSYRLSIAKEWKAAERLESDILEDIKSLFYDLALSTSPNVFKELSELTDMTHILFGSDAPMRIEEGVDRSIEEALSFNGFTKSEKEKVMNGNARHLFPRFSD